MTCTVALVKDGTIWMGADSAASNDSTLDLSGEETRKIFTIQVGVEKCLIGGCGSGRLVQLLECSPHFPPIPDATTSDAMMHWLIVDVVKWIRSTLKEGGIITTKEGVESAPGTLLIGVREKLYEIGGKFYVRSLVDRYAAIGSGSSEALGVFFGLEKFSIECDPQTTILTALKAAERWSPSVRGPFVIIHS